MLIFAARFVFGFALAATACCVLIWQIPLTTLTSIGFTPALLAFGAALVCFGLAVISGFIRLSDLLAAQRPIIVRLFGALNKTGSVQKASKEGRAQLDHTGTAVLRRESAGSQRRLLWLCYLLLASLAHSFLVVGFGDSVRLEVPLTANPTQSTGSAELFVSESKSRFPLPVKISGLSAGPGFAYHLTLQVSWFLSLGQDSQFSPSGSQTVVYEDGLPLPTGHAFYARIVESGQGTYLHWGNSGFPQSVLYFSSPDNTDPIENGRSYRAVFTVLPSMIAVLVIVGFSIPLYARVYRGLNRIAAFPTRTTIPGPALAGALLAIAIVIVVLPLVTHWWTGRSIYLALGGLLPWSDASGWFSRSIQFLHTEAIPPLGTQTTAAHGVLRGIVIPDRRTTAACSDHPRVAGRSRNLFFGARSASGLRSRRGCVCVCNAGLVCAVIWPHVHVGNSRVSTGRGRVHAAVAKRRIQIAKMLCHRFAAVGPRDERAAWSVARHSVALLVGPLRSCQKPHLRMDTIARGDGRRGAGIWCQSCVRHAVRSTRGYTRRKLWVRSLWTSPRWRLLAFVFFGASRISGDG